MKTRKLVLLGIPIDDFSCEEVISHVRVFLNEPKFHRITTVNPEFLLLAEKNEQFRKTLFDADLRVIDGFGIVLGGWMRGKHIRRFPGTDLIEEILKIANKNKLSVFLAVNKNGLSSYKEIYLAILRQYPNLKINGLDIDSYQVSDIGYRVLENVIHNTKYEILLCNFGAPTQEVFLANLKNSNIAPRLAMGVGGAFDYLTNKQKRAPKWLRFIGLEWLWRLIHQPKRFKRIWNSTGFFLFKVFLKH